MLRSYQYTEKPYPEDTFQGRLFRDKQVEIARRFVEGHPVRRDMKGSCPLCGRSGEYFYSKWRVDYLCCPNCKSVFAVYEDSAVKEYQENPNLLELRTSEAYQGEISHNRQDTWDEFLEWVEVRAFRFMGRNRNLDIHSGLSLLRFRQRPCLGLVGQLVDPFDFLLFHWRYLLPVMLLISR